MTFKKWLESHNKKETAIGDLARDIDRDVSFPKVNNMGLILSHLKYMGACPDAIKTFKEAWKQYTTENNKEKK